MNRRRFLELTAGSSVLLAGCSGSSSDTPTKSSPPSGGSSDTPTESSPPEATTSPTESPSETPTETSKEPRPVITEFSVGTGTVRQTRPTPLRATVENTGTAQFQGTVRFGINEESIVEETTAIQPGEKETITTETSLLSVGQYSAEVLVETAEQQYDSARTAFTVHRYPTGFVDVNGTNLTLGDGTAFFAGSSPAPYIYGYDHPTDPTLGREYIWKEFERIEASVIRLRPYAYKSEHDPRPWIDNEDFFRRYDRLLADAKQRDIRVIVSIIDGAPSHYEPSRSSNYTSVTTFVRQVEGAETVADFYEMDDCIKLYKEWVDELVTRENHITGLEYREDPTIMMWELGNEIEFDEKWQRDSIALTPWIEEVGPYVQDKIGDQLLTTGESGWPPDRNDFVADHQPDSIDVCSIHWYPGPEHYDLPEEQVHEALEEVIQTGHDEVEKPVLLGEYNWGVANQDAGPPYERRIEELTEIHEILDTHDVAASTLHALNNWELHHDVHGRNYDPISVYGDTDAGTVEELQRYAHQTRQKSTSSDMPSS